MPLLEIPAVTGLALKAIELVATSRGSKKSLKTEQGVVMNLWGSILFEMRANVERIRFFLKQVDNGGGWYGTLSFDVVDATLPELCRRLPQPIILDQMGRVIAAMRRFNVFQNLAAQCMTDPNQGDPKHMVSLGFARAFVHRQHAERFNRIRDLADSVGKSALKDEWRTLSPQILPYAIDLNQPPTEEFV